MRFAIRVLLLVIVVVLGCVSNEGSNTGSELQKQSYFSKPIATTVDTSKFVPMKNILPASIDSAYLVSKSNYTDYGTHAPTFEFVYVDNTTNETFTIGLFFTDSPFPISRLRNELGNKYDLYTNCSEQEIQQGQYECYVHPTGVSVRLVGAGGVGRAGLFNVPRKIMYGANRDATLNVRVRGEVNYLFADSTYPNMSYEETRFVLNSKVKSISDQLLWNYFNEVGANKTLAERFE